MGATLTPRRGSVPPHDDAFLMLSTLGPEGMATLRQNPQRLKEVNTEVEAMGAHVIAQWALLGQYDFATVLEAPDEKVVTRVAVAARARRPQGRGAHRSPDR